MSFPSFCSASVVVVVVLLTLFHLVLNHVPSAVALPLSPHDDDTQAASLAFQQPPHLVHTTTNHDSDENKHQSVDRQRHHHHAATESRLLVAHHNLMTMRQRSSNNTNNNTTNLIIPFPFTCGNQTTSSNHRVRKELRDLSPVELRRWRTVIRAMMTERPANASFNPPPSFWDLLVAVHIVFGSEAHNGAYFLPWHRFFLLYLENHIRANYYADFALPYWDWSQPGDFDDPSQSTVWGSAFLGGSAFETDPDNISQPVGYGSGAPIPDGPFHGTAAHYLDSHPVRRGFNSSRSGSMRPLVNASVLAALVGRKVAGNWTWGAFSDALETAHNLVHSDIGGDMLVTRTSPNDPVFYVHHAFVDKIWWDRQRANGWREFGGNHSFPTGARGNGSSASEAARTVNVSAEFVFRYFNLSVNVSFEQQCVTYQAYTARGIGRRGGTGGGTGGGTERTGNVTETKTGTEGGDMCEETDMMSVERCRNGEAVLEAAGQETT